ncbi:MAG: biotin--[acetyl-CoA-carboxylase] ligase [Erysipelotrichaceae bacterium]|nr:biotin--[acetyl-CoA-carboxylase] ligase [Erysipelotrichaceae bacterium]
MKIIEFNELPSTNTYLKENHNNYSTNTVIRALKQTNGRGRFDRQWLSDDDLTFSILFKEQNANHHLIAPLAIVYALLSYNIRAQIKWPNDIYINDKKLAGILIECIYEQGKKSCDIVGIGINTSKKNNELNATFVNVDSSTLLSSIIRCYKKLLPVGNSFLLNLYRSYSSVLGLTIHYKGIDYQIINFTEDLKLILENADNTIIVSANEIDIKSSIVK